MKYSSGKYYRDVLLVEVNKTIKKLEEEEDKKEPILKKIKEWVLSFFKNN